MKSQLYIVNTGVKRYDFGTPYVFSLHIKTTSVVFYANVTFASVEGSSVEDLQCKLNNMVKE